MKKRIALLLCMVLTLSMCVFCPGASVSAAEYETMDVFSDAGAHSAVVRNDGTVWMWGYNNYGQLGDGTKTKRNTPVQVKNLYAVKEVAVGDNHTLALKEDGTVWAWGRNNRGQLGDDTIIARTTPVQVKELSGIVAVSAGWQYSAALKSDGTVWTWGDNEEEILGVGTSARYITKPTQVKKISNVKAISCGSAHTMALKTDGTVWGWGNNGSGEVGCGFDYEDGYVESWTVPPKQAKGISNITAITAGRSHTIALHKDGTLYSWGYNFYRELGDGTSKDREFPVKVKNLSGVSALMSGKNHTVALKKDGTVWSWGNNETAQLGIGKKSVMSHVVQTKNLSDVSAVYAAGMHSWAVKKDGTVWWWGLHDYGPENPDLWGANLSPTPVKTKDGAAFSTIAKAKAATGLKLNKSTAKLETGAVLLLTPTISPTNATERTIRWSSSDSSVAKVGQNGVVTAKAPGTAKITAKLGKLTRICTVTVGKPGNYVSLRIGKARAIRNGQKTTIDAEGTKPFIISGRTMVPIRFIGEKLGAKVKYKDDKSPITITYGKKTVSLKLGEKVLTVRENNKTKTVKLDAAAQKRNGRTFLPLRAIGQALSFAVHYDSGTKIIVVAEAKMSVVTKSARVKEAKAYITK